MAPSNQNDQDSQVPQERRRSSIVDIFNPLSQLSGQNSGPRRLSITTLGLSSLPAAQPSPFGNMRARAESLSSANSASVDDSPFEDEHNSPPANYATNSNSASPFGRRMSFGTSQMLRGSNTVAGVTGSKGNSTAGNGAANGRPPVSSTNPSITQKASASSSQSKSREGYDFAETLRARAQRSSMSGGYAGFLNQQVAQTNAHIRAKSIATIEPPKAELPKQPVRPDAFQERILKGDFYMD